ncbi:MAG: pentapeptide repeat-containing protein [Spirochaetaceae bacterium]|jgi:uncharacterized protein YjbI with pentapeptide repeats|nr:pentapeptide repeat-containing protein [Spirochaetaceae bacterium]
MFRLVNCDHQHCTKSAIILPGEELHSGLRFCFDHNPDKKGLQLKIETYIRENDTIVGLNASGMSFSGMDFSGKRFYSCDFRNCIFLHITSSGCRIRMSFFDFARFINCALVQSNFQYTSFGGAVMSSVVFTNSDLVHNNFNGLTAVQTSFDDSDLYNSRFIRARLLNTSFRNCNIKKTLFYEHTEENVSFKLSNTREAFFRLEDYEK